MGRATIDNGSSMETSERVLPRALSWIFQPLIEHRRALVTLNVFYFGMLAVGVIFATFAPEVQQSLIESVGEAFSTGTLAPVVEAYTSGQVLAAILLTFAVNLLLGTIVVITLPSLVIPFAGLAMGALRAFLWGVLFAPGSGLGFAILPHILTILIEGEAYVVALLGVWLWWQPVFTNSGRRFRAWLDGLVLQGRIVIAVAVILLVAAIYEVLEVVFIVPLLG